MKLTSIHNTLVHANNMLERNVTYWYFEGLIKTDRVDTSYIYIFKNAIIKNINSELKEQLK